MGVNEHAPNQIASAAFAIRARHCASERYAGEREEVLNEAGFTAAERQIRGWPGYAETAAHEVARLAARLGVASIAYKDEGGRFGSGASSP
jgi:diaminopropionate ammonia-lyase